LEFVADVESFVVVFDEVDAFVEVGAHGVEMLRGKAVGFWLLAG
jgi:hypothetical protein